MFRQADELDDIKTENTATEKKENIGFKDCLNGEVTSDDKCETDKTEKTDDMHDKTEECEEKTDGIPFWLKDDDDSIIDDVSEKKGIFMRLKYKIKQKPVKYAIIVLVLCILVVAGVALFAVFGNVNKDAKKEELNIVATDKFGFNDNGETDVLVWSVTSDNTLIIEGNGKMDNYSMRGECEWREYLSRIEKIEIRDGVENVGANAFNGCRVSRIIFGKDIMRIEEMAFANCEKLNEIVFPDNLKVIGPKAFFGCSYLKNVTMCENIESIAYDAFDYCHADFKITAPEESLGGRFTANYLGQHSEPSKVDYTENDNITDNGVCGNGVTWILYSDNSLIISGDGEMSDFDENLTVPWEYYKTVITSVEIKNGITYVGKNSFSDATALQSVKVNCETVGERAFYGCTSLTKVEFYSGTKTIKNEAFAKCGALKEIHIPGSVSKIEFNSFDKCDATVYGKYNSFACLYAFIKGMDFRRE